MRIQILLMAGILAGIAVCGRSAEAQVGGVRANISFRFSVGGKTFAAGEYMVVAGSHQVRVVSPADGRTIAMVLANDVSGRLPGPTGRVVFRCYAEQCFLREVWSPMEMNGRQVMISEAEKESGKEQRGTYFAILGSKPHK